MKKEKLIEELQKLPDGIEVCVFDWRKNLNADYGDGEGCSAGIYPNFDIEVQQKNTIPEKTKPFATLNILNDDYDNNGGRIVE